MNEFSLRITIGLFMVTSHFLLIIFIFVSYVAGGFSFPEMTTTVGLVAPLFAGYTSVIIAFIVKNKSNVGKESNITNIAYAFLAFFLPCVFIAALSVVVLLKSYNKGFASFEDFKTSVGVIESAFGIYVGQFIYSMFEASKNSSVDSSDIR